MLFFVAHTVNSRTSLGLTLAQLFH